MTNLFKEEKHDLQKKVKPEWNDTKALGLRVVIIFPFEL